MARPDGVARPEGGVVDARPLPRSFFERDPLDVAPEMLNKVLVRDDGRAGRIVEVEAYCGSLDPGSHAFRGRTARNATMFGPAGHLYVYFTYGMHFCANAVCGPVGEGVAVLLRGLTPVASLGAMRAARASARSDAELCAGPARLCLAMGIDRRYDGCDIVTGDMGLTVVDDGTAPPQSPGVGRRVGLSVGKGEELPWRWVVPGAVGVSRALRTG